MQNMESYYAAKRILRQSLTFQVDNHMLLEDVSASSIHIHCNNFFARLLMFVRMDSRENQLFLVISNFILNGKNADTCTPYVTLLIQMLSRPY